MKTGKAFSIIEVVFAGGIFIAFSSAFVLFFLQSLSDDRRNAEFSVATAFAAEGLEAVNAMRREDFPSLGTVSEGGLESVGGNGWRFQGGHDFFEKYERLITAEYASRNDGDIVIGGTLDEKVMRVTSLVRWQSTSGQEETVSLSRYITYWNEPL